MWCWFHSPVCFLFFNNMRDSTYLKFYRDLVVETTGLDTVDTSQLVGMKNCRVILSKIFSYTWGCPSIAICETVEPSILSRVWNSMYLVLVQVPNFTHSSSTPNEKKLRMWCKSNVKTPLNLADATTQDKSSLKAELHVAQCLYPLIQTSSLF